MASIALLYVVCKFANATFSGTLSASKGKRMMTGVMSYYYWMSLPRTAQDTLRRLACSYNTERMSITNGITSSTSRKTASQQWTCFPAGIAP